jgi:hypothetical protein
MCHMSAVAVPRYAATHTIRCGRPGTGHNPLTPRTLRLAYMQLNTSKRCRHLVDGDARWVVP